MSIPYDVFMSYGMDLPYGQPGCVSQAFVRLLDRALDSRSIGGETKRPAARGRRAFW